MSDSDNPRDDLEPPPAAASARPASQALRQPAAEPPPQRRSRASRNQVVVFMNFVMSAVILMVVAAGAAVYFGKQSFETPGPLAAAKTFLVKPGTGTSEIAALLERNGVISNARIFQLGVRAYGGADPGLKAGEYEAPAGASMRDIMALLQGGKSIQHSVTIPEGLTVTQALRRIADDEALTGDLPSPAPAEGSIAADTQTFTRGDTRKEIVAKLASRQTAFVEAAWAKRAPDLPLADIGEFLTLASIVEKETGLNDERGRVASVFVNRLRKNMRLQSDPTIIYGLFQGAGKPPDRPIYQSDLEKKTPYNTYVINGLPPTPIAIPGRAALEAVANPARTDDLYFVADGTGGHVFAKSLAEHNRNVARYRAIQKEAEEAAKAGGAPAPAASPSIQPLP